MDAINAQRTGVPGDVDAELIAASPEPPCAEILIVDDDPRSLFALTGLLEQDGLKIISAGSGEEALKQVLNHDLALILLDVRMPGMDGYETASLIRGRERSRHIPIIFLTAMDRDDVHIFRGYSAGAVDYVYKPVEPLILRSKVNVFVELFRKTEAIRREEQLKNRLQAENLRVRSEMLHAERALRMSEERQSLIIDALPVALYCAPLAPDFAGPRFLTDKITRIAGFPARSFEEPDSFWADRIHPDDRERVLREVSAIRRNGSFATDYRWQCADGNYRYFFDRAVLVEHGEQDAREAVGIWLDVTERHQLEQQLFQSQKMQALGQLTGGIAHDFSNMLTAVLGSLDLLSRTLEPDSKAGKRAQTALQGALRCSDLTRRLLMFARQKPLERGVVDLKTIVDGMAEIFEQTTDETVEIEVQHEPGVWLAVAEKSYLESSLLNLVINARDALPEGGKIVIETGNRVFEHGFDNGNFRAEPGEYVMLAVRDNGTGMPESVLAHIFEPFFTTKEPGHGTGLGLSMIYSFVQECGGFIIIDSTPGCGTTVRLFLRRKEETANGAATAAASSTRALAGEAVLVVEDDVDVLCATADSLRELGYDVLEATTGMAALELLEGGRRVDLLFTDIAMPGGMNGWQLARAVAQRHPAVGIILTSGHPDRTLGNEGADGCYELLRKPYRVDELAEVIRRVLEQAQPEASFQRYSA